MIPFEIDPFPYYCFVAALFAIFLLYWMGKEQSSELIILPIILLSFLCIVCIIGIFGGSVYTDTITICKHESSASSMTVIDIDDNIYYIGDPITKFRIEDGKTINVKVKESFGNKVIYSIDAPITCANQTCGVST
jgi:ABC-type microcin C transport system permease subunit YejB